MSGTGKLATSILFVAVLVIAAVTGFLTSVRPLLGLDLVGGVSVVLSAPGGTDKGVMEKALDRIRERVDALGVAEPDISLLGNNFIQVQLPGLGGQGTVVKQGNQFCAKSSAGKIVGCRDTLADAQALAKAQSVQRVLQIIGTTARLDQRAVQATLPSTDKTPFTQGVLQANDPCLSDKSCTQAPADSAGGLVTYQDNNNNGFYDANVDTKYNLGPVLITGAALKKATAVYVT